MSYTLRAPGSASFYAVQFRTSGPCRHPWSNAGNLVDSIRHVKRHASNADYWRRREVEPFQSYSHGGETYQRTANRGFPDTEDGEALAFSMLALLREAHPHHEFRVARVTVEIVEEDVSEPALCAS